MNPYNYCAEELYLATLHEWQRRPLKKPGPDVPKSLREVNGEPVPAHASLKLIAALAGCLAEIHAAQLAGREMDIERFVETDLTKWSTAAANRKLLVIWADTCGNMCCSAGPNLYELIRCCSGASSSATRSDDLQ